MSSTNEQLIQMNQAMLELSQTLVQSQAHQQKAMCRQRWLMIILVTLFSMFFIGSKGSFSNASSQVPEKFAVPSEKLDTQTRADLRKTLIDQLPKEERQKLQDFERQVQWVSQYMSTWDQGMEGAVVALMLRNMSKSMESVPEMLEQMKLMNTLMNAMPVVANEMQRMNANMSIMTYNMDSTMGRMGRRLPW